MGRQDDDLAMEPWYWRDWRASKARSVFVAQDEELGRLAGWCYRELLDAHWAEPDCSLPDTDKDLAALAGVSLTEWESVKDLVLRWIPLNRRGRRQNKRAFHEWKRAHGLRDEKREKAQAAAKARWDKKKPGMQTQCASNAYALPVMGMPADAVTDANAGDNGTPPQPPASGGGGHDGRLEVLATLAASLGLEHGRQERRAWRDGLERGLTLDGIRAGLESEAERRRVQVSHRDELAAAGEWVIASGGQPEVAQRLADWLDEHQREGEFEADAAERWRAEVAAPPGTYGVVARAVRGRRRVVTG